MASRSYSPNPSRPSTHSSRTPEATRRHSCSSESILSGSSEDFRHRRGRDAVCSTPPRPSSSSSKSAKRFMSPTISAASKAVAASPSPRRKILGERNEDVVVLQSFRTPESDAVLLKKPAVVASKDWSCRELRPGPELGFGSQDAPCYCCGGGGECGEQMKEEGAEIKNHRSDVLRTFRISPAASVPFVADRHLPPYDPDKNYLSPRPRFLHYRPNPRIEQYLHGEREFLVMEDGKRLDDCFSDESCEDSSACVGEVHSSDLGEEYDEEESSMGSFSQSRSSTAAASGDIAQDLACGPTVEAGGNSHASSVLKFAPFLLVLIVVCVMPLFFWGAPVVSSAPSSLTKAPVLQVIDDLRIRDYLAVSSLNFKKVAYKLKQFSSNTFGTAATLGEIGRLYVDNFTSPTMESSDQRRQPDTELSNNTCLEEERTGGDDETMVMIEPEVSGDVLEGVADMEVETTEQPEVKVELYIDEIEKMEDLCGGEGERIDSPPPEAESFLTKVVDLLEHDGDQMIQEKDDDGNTESKEETTLETEIVEDLLPDVSTGNEFFVSGHEYDTGSFPPQIPLPDSGEVYSQSFSKAALDSQELSVHASADGNHPWAKLVLGVSSTLILLAAALFFLWWRKQSEALTENQSSANLNLRSPARGTYESSSNLMESSSVGPRRSTKGGGEEDYNLSPERSSRRDSVTLSFTTSYGSFTAYEKVHAKKGGGGKAAEAMTPVRRSSRIKNQVTTS